MDNETLGSSGLTSEDIGKLSMHVDIVGMTIEAVGSIMKAHWKRRGEAEMAAFHSEMAQREAGLLIKLHEDGER